MYADKRGQTRSPSTSGRHVVSAMGNQQSPLVPYLADFRDPLRYPDTYADFLSCTQRLLSHILRFYCKQFLQSLLSIVLGIRWGNVSLSFCISVCRAMQPRQEAIISLFQTPELWFAKNLETIHVKKRRKHEEVDWRLARRFVHQGSVSESRMTVADP